MRFLLILALITCATAAHAAVEQLTLVDGRTFVGVYDDEARQLHATIAGRDVVMALTADQIAERAPYRAKAAKPAAAGAAPEAPAKMTAEEKARAKAAMADAELQRRIDDFEGQASKADREAAAAHKAADAKREEAKRLAKAFRDRAKAEQKHLREGAAEHADVTLDSGATNARVHDAQAAADELDQKAAGLEATAKARRADAEQLRGGDAAAKP
jgi:hypothetical protein